MLFTHISCGVRQLYNVELIHEKYEWLRELKQLAKGNGDFAYLIFSDVIREEIGGKILAEEIVKAGLGSIGKSEEAINPNTGNRICVWLWRVTPKQITSFVKVKDKP